MSVSSLTLFSSWRDYWADYGSFVEPLIAPIESSTCHANRYGLVPDVSHQTIPASGYTQYNFHLPVGSLIWGLFPANKDYAVQLTDVSMGHRFFQEPLQVSLLFTAGGLNAQMPAQFLLPSPHPVVGDGLFTFEVWGDVGTTVVMILGVAEVTDCPVR
jgi:hypothetical protein